MSFAMAVVFVVVGFLLLYYGGDWIVTGSVRLAARLGVEPVVIGLTVVAFGTSLPEMLVSLFSAVQGHCALAVGNILGSDIFNLCLIVGISALVANPLAGSQAVARRDMNVLLAGMLLFGVLGRDLRFSRADGLVLSIFFAAYMMLTVKRPISDEPDEEVLEALRDLESPGAEAGAQPPEDSGRAVDERTGEGCDRSGQEASGEGDGKCDHVYRPTAVPSPWGHVLAGLLALPVGAELLVRGGVFLAESAGVSERFVAMTIVSWGTSLPELATSLAAAFRGHSGLCIGNVVGSNLFNTVFIMGFTSMVVDIPVTVEAYRYDYVLACVATVLLAVLHRGGRSIGRTGGILLLLCFLVMFAVLSC